MKTSKILAGYAALLLLLDQTQAARAQNPQPAGGSSLIQTVEPSFRIEPIVHRITGRRGEVIPFQFEIASLGKQMNLKVVPVNLRQEETGVILHDQSGKPSDSVKLTSPAEFELGPGEAKFITGEVTIPIAKTNYISLGILVQDLGQAPKFDQIEGQPSATKAGIRFVTQYVLRVDIETGNADPREFGNLRLENGEIFSQQGLPMVRTYLDNPTNFAYECQVRATIESDLPGKARPFFLGMPSRSSLEDDGKYLVRIMPKSRLRLEAPVDFPIFSGEQTLKVGVTNGRREVASEEFALKLSPNAFPGLDSQIAYVGKQLAVSPSQVEVGTVRGANRMVGMKFVNSSPTDQEVLLRAKTLNGEQLEGLRLSPDSFKVRAGKSKSVRVKVQTLKDEPVDGLGEIMVVAQSATGEQAERKLPLMVRRTERRPPNVVVSEIEYLTQGGRPVFQLKVTNAGDSFVPISADLEVASAKGRAMQLSSGYGKWIRPGAVETLTFVPHSELSGGEYLLSLAVRTYDDLPPKSRTLSIQLKSQASETSQVDSPKVLK